MSDGSGGYATGMPGGARGARFSGIALALAVALVSGCGTVGDEAEERAAECGYHGSAASSEASCEGEVSCASECAAEAPCGVFDGSDAIALAQYMACLDAC